MRRTYFETLCEAAKESKEYYDKIKSIPAAAKKYLFEVYNVEASDKEIEEFIKRAETFINIPTEERRIKMKLFSECMDNFIHAIESSIAWGYVNTPYTNAHVADYLAA